MANKKFLNVLWDEGNVLHELNRIAVPEKFSAIAYKCHKTEKVKNGLYAKNVILKKRQNKTFQLNLF